jgi:LPXTG-motif cell wall-anchored protein
MTGNKFNGITRFLKGKRSLYAVLLTMMFLLTTSIAVYAEQITAPTADPPAGTYCGTQVSTFENVLFAGGNGTELDPYQVATAEQLNNVRYHLDKHFIQTANIDLNAAPYNTDLGWEPIGSYGSPFNGTFNGNGKTISNLTINRSTADYVGLFGIAGQYAKIQNVKLENTTVTGRNNTGGLVGTNADSITNSCATGAVTGSEYVGGLVGYNLVGDITNSYATVAVSGGTWVGGLAGYNDWATISGSYTTGAVTGTAYVGGLVGQNRQGSITNSYATVAVTGTDNYVGGLVGCNQENSQITSSYAIGTVVGKQSTGGLVGENWGTITKSYATGDVTGSGGVAGLAGSNSGTITNSYARGAATGTQDHIGGLVGWNNEGRIYHAYSTGVVTGRTFVGGLVGRSDSGIITYSYWDKDASGRDKSTVGEGKTTEEMKQQVTFANWDFNTIWNIDGSTNDGYPFLTIFAGGSGTKEDPYLVATAEQLNNVRYRLNKHFKQTANIDLNVAPYNTGAGWEPIGIYGSPFSGTFDGNGKTISNLTINRSANYSVGLFGYSSNTAEMQNVKMENTNVTGGNNTGALVGDNRATITNSYAKGAVTGTGFCAGGLVGYNYKASISDSYATGTVAGSKRVGGLVGENWGTITNSYATGTVTGSAYVGGLVGYNALATISGSYTTGTVNGQQFTGGLVGDNCGTITKSSATGDVTGTGNYVGGLVGYNQQNYSIADSYATGTVVGKQSTGGLVGENWGTITKSYATGDVTGSGGVAGLAGSNSGTITNSYARGAATGTQDHIGGLVGYNHGGTISYAYATGAVAGPGIHIGGLVGEKGTVTKSYWDTTTSGTKSSAGGEGVAGKTTAEMKQQVTFADWDFTSIWKIESSKNDGYPFLKDNPAHPDLDAVYAVRDALTWDIIKGENSTPDNIINNLTNPLPTAGTNGTSISWSADPVAWINTTTGEVTRPTSGHQTVVLTATISKGIFSGIKKFVLTIIDPSIVATPSASLASGTYGETKKITLSTVTEEATIYYTTDNSDPAISNTRIQYTGEIEVTGNMTIKAIAVKVGMENSPVATFEYIIVVFDGGDGSLDNPYQVAIPEQLDNVRECLDKHFIQKADIDLSSYHTDGGWIPIGVSGSSFTGTFNGNGKTISNLTINRSTTDYVGLFGVTGATAQIQNMKLENTNVTGKQYTGALVGRNEGTITDSYATGAVTGAGTYVGGLVGFNTKAISGSYTTGTVNGQQRTGGLAGENGGTITNSYATGAVTGAGTYVGGLVGFNTKAISGSYTTGTVNGQQRTGGLAGENKGTITNSYATGAVTSADDYVGGLVGYNQQNSSITDSYAIGKVFGRQRTGGLVGESNGTIASSYSTGAVTSAYDYVGGLVGYNSGSIINSYATGAVTDAYDNGGGLVGYNSGSIINSYATGAVTDAYAYVGGLVGWNSGSVTNSYATGAVTGTLDVGGLVGINRKGSISESYATGAVTGSKYIGGLAGVIYEGSITNSYATGAVTGIYDHGGLAGSYTSGTITNSYWDKDTSGRDSSAGGEGKTTEQMKEQETYVGWDFNDTWSIEGSKNNGYPFLKNNPPATSATISPTTAFFDKKAGSQADVTATITWNSATNVTAVKKGDAALTANTDYTVAGNTLTIKKEYLAALAVGDVALTIVFDKGDAAALNISVSDTTPVTYTLTLSGDGLTSDPGAGAITENTSVTITVTPTAGKQVATFTVNGIDKKAELVNSKYTFTIIEDTTVAVTYEDIPPVKYAITIANVEGGTATVTTDPAAEASEGATVTVSIAGIEAGKQFKSITVTDADSGAVAITTVTAGESYTFTMPAKAVTVTVAVAVEAIPVVSAAINPTTASFDKKAGSQADVTTTITWNSATNVTAVKKGDAVLMANTDYTISGNTLTIKQDYLATQSAGDLVLTVEFDHGSPATLTISITDTTPPSTYTVTYHANGGTGTAPIESDKAAGETFTAAAANSFTAPAGYRFKEWNTSSDGTGTGYAARTQITMPAEALNLYAIWEETTVVTDLTAYNGALAAIKETNYTAESWATYQAVVNANVVTAENTQEEVDAATAAILAAQADLVFAGQAGLDTAAAAADQLKETDYTKASWAVLEAALAMPETTNAEVVAKTKAINEAISNLEEATEETEETSNRTEETEAISKKKTEKLPKTGSFPLVFHFAGLALAGIGVFLYKKKTRLTSF